MAEAKTQAAKAASKAASPPPAPQFYIAESPLYVGGEAAMPARAFNPGDHVPAEMVTSHGWESQVREPTAAEAYPAQTDSGPAAQEE